LIMTIIGWFTIFLSLMVGPPQLYKVIKTKEVRAVSKLTYLVLIFYMMLLLARAIYILDFVFIITNSLGILINGAILFLLVYYTRRWKKVVKAFKDVDWHTIDIVTKDGHKIGYIGEKENE